MVAARLQQHTHNRFYTRRDWSRQYRWERVGTVEVGTGGILELKRDFATYLNIRYGTVAGLLIVETKELFLCFVIDCHCSLQR